MLGKLFKHEFRATGKLLIPLYLGLIALAFICNIILSPGSYFIVPMPSSLISSFIVMIYMLTLFTSFILTAVYLTIRFFKTMYGNQAYLTHTLPVSTISVLNVKILTAGFWLAAAFLISILSMFVLGDYDIRTFVILQDDNGMYVRGLILMLLITLLAVGFNIILMVCASLSVGQLFRQFRIPAAIGAYVVFYLIQQIASVVSLVLFGFSQIEALEEAASQMAYTNLYRQLLGLAASEAVIFGVIYYFICYYITKKHLNLE